jgi:hypothetical protein
MRRTAVILTLACLLQFSYAEKQKPPQYKVQVNVVSIDLEVLDSQGKPVDNLEQKDFVVKENGAPVEISSFARLSDVNVSLVIALGTGFMTQSGLSIAKDAISQLIHLLRPEDEICLLSFDQKDVYMEQDFTRERPDIGSALENIGVVSRSKRPGRLRRGFITPPQTALGVDHGFKVAKRGIYQRKAVILIRDSMDSLVPSSLGHLRESGCMLIALGFDGKEQDRLTLINDESGAKQLILGQEETKASGQDGDVTELCRTISRLLASRYNITYHTPAPDVLGPRQIEVLVPGHDYRIVAQRSL